MRLATITAAFEHIGPNFSLWPFAKDLAPLIEAVLKEHGKEQLRQGTLLPPKLLVWLVLVLTVRRDLNCRKALNWIVSGFRGITALLPAQAALVAEGTISHARVQLGVALFRTLFARLTASFPQIAPDFHGRVTVLFDGSSGTLPDTPSNNDQFGKPSSRCGQAAFPQIRMVALLAVSVRLILEVAYGPYRGKGRGERASMFQILDRVRQPGLLFLLDAGLYAFEMLWQIGQREQDFIVKVPATVKLKPVEYWADGSFLARLTKQIQDPDAPPTPKGRKRWQTVSLLVRVIRVHIPGFRPFCLITSLLDPAITAREIAVHYHKRWDVEVAYDEIKTHQCATLGGQLATTFRSKRADLVEQELYALLIMYNLIRLLIWQAAVQHGKDPRFLSFLDALQHILDATPIMTATTSRPIEREFEYLLAVIADCDIDRPRRPRINPRVVKVKMSKFRRKNSTHQSAYRDLEAELEIIPEVPEPANPENPVPLWFLLFAGVLNQALLNGYARDESEIKTPQLV
jgi:hypothetical protein